MIEVYIMRVPISLPCVVPVRPSDGMSAIDGEPLPDEERTEKCCRDAWWTFELAPVCDMHLRQILTVVDDNYDSFISDFKEKHPHYEGPLPTEGQEWTVGYRYPQEKAAMLGDGNQS